MVVTKSVVAGVERIKPLSRRYTVRESAEKFMDLARKAGTDCYIKVIHGMEGRRGEKRATAVAYGEPKDTGGA